MSLLTVGPAMITGFSGENLLDNSDFEIAQRGTSKTGITANEVLLDRWRLNPSGATLDASRGSFSPGDLAAADAAGVRYYAQVTATAAGDNWGVSQFLPDVTRLSEGLVTVSGWVRLTSTSGNVDLVLRRNFGVGGSAEEDTTRSQTGLTDGVWTFVEETFDLSLSGKTISADSSFGLFILDPDFATGTIDVAMLKIEYGAAATACRRRPPAIEWSTALHHYRQSYLTETAPGTVTDTGATVHRKPAANTSITNIYFRFDRPLHAIPTVTLYSSNSGNAGFLYDGSSDVAASTARLSDKGFDVVLDGRLWRERVLSPLHCRSGGLTMPISAVRRTRHGTLRVSYDNGRVTNVPDDTGNRDRREVQAFADRGGTIDDVPLVERKVPLIEGVEARRETKLRHGFIVKGERIGLDEVGQRDMVAMQAALNAGITSPHGGDWRGRGRRKVPLSDAELAAMVRIALVVARDIRNAADEKLDEIDALDTVATIDAYDLEAGWPAEVDVPNPIAFLQSLLR